MTIPSLMRTPKALTRIMEAVESLTDRKNLEIMKSAPTTSLSGLPITGKKIFITGGAGFVATKLIERLVEANSITVFDNFYRDTISSTSLGSHPNVTIIRGDVLDFDQLSQSMRGADIVVHAAAITGIDTVIKAPTRTMRVNMVGTANVLEAAHANNVAGRIIDFSTSEVFGSLAYKSTEDGVTVAGSAGEARWTYAVSKLAGEHLALSYNRQFQLPVVCVRPFNVYGPGQTGESALKNFVVRALAGEELQIYGDGSQIRAWCFVDDFIDCLLICMSKPDAIGHSFNIGNPRAVVTTFGLAQTVCRVLNSKSQIVFQPPLSADVEIRVPSVEKSKALLGFSAQVDLEEGIRRTAAWFAREK